MSWLLIIGSWIYLEDLEFYKTKLIFFTMVKTNKKIFIFKNFTVVCMNLLSKKVTLVLIYVSINFLWPIRLHAVILLIHFYRQIIWLEKLNHKSNLTYIHRLRSQMMSLRLDQAEPTITKWGEKISGVELLSVCNLIFYV